MKSTLALFVASLLAYLALHQRALYAGDGFFILASAANGSLQNTSHEGYFPVLAGFGWLLRTLGIELTPALTVTTLSALGTAIGVAASHRALLRLLADDQARATWGAALVATAPAVTFFATAVEYHGAFFAASQLALLAVVRLAQRASLARAGLATLAMTAAALMHGSGMCLGALLVPLILRTHGRRAARDVGLVAVAGLVGLALAVMGLRQLGVSTPPPITPASFLREIGRTIRLLAYLPWALAMELLVPFTPVALAALWTLRTHRHDLWSWASSVLIYAAANAVVLAGVFWERGAYCLPFAALHAYWTVRHGTRPLWLATACLGSLLGTWGLWRHDQLYHQYEQAIAGAVQATQPHAPAMLVADLIERGAINVVPGAPLAVDLHHFALLSAERLRAALPQSMGYLDSLRRSGKLPVVSDRALTFLRDQSPSGRLLADALSDGAWQRVVTPTFSGFVLRHD